MTKLCVSDLAALNYLQKIPRAVAGEVKFVPRVKNTCQAFFEKNLRDLLKRLEMAIAAGFDDAGAPLNDKLNITRIWGDHPDTMKIP